MHSVFLFLFLIFSLKSIGNPFFGHIFITLIDHISMYVICSTPSLYLTLSHFHNNRKNNTNKQTIKIKYKKRANKKLWKRKCYICRTVFETFLGIFGALILTAHKHFIHVFFNCPQLFWKKVVVVVAVWFSFGKLKYPCVNRWQHNFNIYW